MPRWVIGDVQGCCVTLEHLLQRLGDADPLWFVGDLINRGPESERVLHLVRSLGERATVVLGNHELHLMARAQGAPAGKHDTLDGLLASPKLPELLEWLRQLPLLVEQDGWLMCHAGLLPRWSLDDARSWARRAEAALRGPDWRGCIQRLRVNTPWDLATPEQRLSLAIGALTRIRMVDGYGEPTGYSGAPEEAPPGLWPWWERSAIPQPGRRVAFGHWAALGYRDLPGVLAVDTGCIWGRTLTAVALETGEQISVPCAETSPRQPRGGAR